MSSFEESIESDIIRRIRNMTSKSSRNRRRRNQITNEDLEVLASLKRLSHMAGMRSISSSSEYLKQSFEQDYGNFEEFKHAEDAMYYIDDSAQLYLPATIGHNNGRPK